MNALWLFCTCAQNSEEVAISKLSLIDVSRVDVVFDNREVRVKFRRSLPLIISIGGLFARDIQRVGVGRELRICPGLPSVDDSLDLLSRGLNCIVLEGLLLLSESYHLLELVSKTVHHLLDALGSASFVFDGGFVLFQVWQEIFGRDFLLSLRLFGLLQRQLAAVLSLVGLPAPLADEFLAVSGQLAPEKTRFRILIIFVAILKADFIVLLFDGALGLPALLTGVAVKHALLEHDEKFRNLKIGKLVILHKVTCVMQALGHLVYQFLVIDHL